MIGFTKPFRIFFKLVIGKGWSWFPLEEFVKGGT